MKTLRTHPDFVAAQMICDRLVQAGHQTLFAGGCVRDGLLGRVPQDLDLATSAQPEQVEALFAKTVPVGKSFGVIVVIEQGVEIEVATFREDLGQKDSRHPAGVQWSSPEKDAARRDLTINALFWDPQTNLILDFVDGQRDLVRRTLRFVGNPQQRLSEDHLRAWRVLRFVSQLGFTMEVETRRAVVMAFQGDLQVSPERRRQEMERFLRGAFLDVAWPEFFAASVLASQFPGVQFSSDLQVYLIQWLAAAPPNAWPLFWSALRLCGLRLGSAQMRKQLQDWRFPNFEQSQILAFSQWFGVEAIPEKPRLGAWLEMFFDVACESGFRLAQVTPGTQVSQKSAAAQAAGAAHQKWRDLFAANPVKPQPLLTGPDLQILWQGRELGLALQRVYWAQLEGLVTTREQAIEWVRESQQHGRH